MDTVSTPADLHMAPGPWRMGPRAASTVPLGTYPERPLVSQLSPMVEMNRVLKAAGPSGSCA